MKTKKILLSALMIVIIAVALLFFYGATQPKEVSLERSVVIQQDIETVYSYVSDFRNWKEWSVWNLRDTSMVVAYSGDAGSAGSAMSWESEDSGNGKQTIVEAIPNSQIKTALDFGGMGTALSDWKFEPVPEGTSVTWSFWSETGGPFMRGIMALFFDMEEAIGKDYEEGLENLKKRIEMLPKSSKAEAL